TRNVALPLHLGSVQSRDESGNGCGLSEPLRTDHGGVVSAAAGGRVRGEDRTGNGGLGGAWPARPSDWLSLNYFLFPLQVTNQLLDLQWKMGMAVSSDSCKSLKSPYVAVTLKVADQSGQITNKSFEMTIPQFQYFFKQFKEMAAVIETV
uniref:COMM domain-containing protein 6 n=2 Tax=Dasyuridae TaxID=9277 RepID=A0A7N4PBC8_SARHA